MTQIAALSKYLLSGHVVTIMNAFNLFSITNAPREVSRGIEQKFGVQISRTRKEFVSRYGQPGFYFEYRLNYTEYNKEGIQKMREYCAEIEKQPYIKLVKKGPKIITPKQETKPILSTNGEQGSLFGE